MRHYKTSRLNRQEVLTIINSYRREIPLFSFRHPNGTVHSITFEDWLVSN